MGGLLLGPAIGAIGAASFGGIGFVFVFSGVAALLAALPLIAKARGRGESHERTHPAPGHDGTEFPPDAPVHASAARPRIATPTTRPDRTRARRPASSTAASSRS